MPAPYSIDLRERVVRAYLSGDDGFEEVAERFEISEPTARRWVCRYRVTQSLFPLPMGGDRHSKFDEESEALLELLVEEDPGVTRDELVVLLFDEIGLEVSTSAVQRALERLDLTRKKRRSMRRNATLNG